MEIDEDLIRDIQNYLLAKTGILYFNKIKSTPKDIMVSCPFHKEGQERKPSCGIKKYDDEKGGAGQVHCFSGDTKVLTRKGVYTIRDLCGVLVEILNGNGDWELVKFKNYGIQKLLKVNISCNGIKKSIYATDEHEWIIHRRKSKVYTKDLKKGQYLEKIIPRCKCNIELDTNGIRHGFVYGDGSSYVRINYYYNRVSFYNNIKEEISKYFPNVHKYTHSNNNVYLNASFKSQVNYKLPPDIDNYNISYILGFLAGYFVADGNCTDKSMSISSSDYENLCKIKDLFTFCNIVTYPIRKQYCAPNKFCNSERYLYVLGIVKSTVPENFFITTKRPNSIGSQRGRLCWKVESVEITNREEMVYCCETSTHSFALSDFILVGNCFSCGEQTNLIGMLQKILGTLYNETEVESRFHLRQMSYQSILQEKPKPLFKLPSQVEYVPESVLRRFRGVYHPYLERRGISKETAELYDIGYEDENKHITFPIKDQQNRCVGIGRRSVIGKQYYYPQGMVKPLYGLYEITFPIRSLWVVEGPFNMWSLTQWGKKAVAMLGTGTSYQYEQFKDLAVDIYVLALDPDPAGRNGTRKLAEYLFNIGKHRVFVCDLPDGKDINDLSHEEFRGCEVLSYYEWKNKYKIL